MNEALLNLGMEDLTTKEGQDIAIDIMNYMREVLTGIQEETGQSYNLEATPAEGTAYRLARKDKAQYPKIVTAGTQDVPYYTNSSQLPVGYTDDIFEMMDCQDELQSLYTGGTVQHLYLGQRIEDINVCKSIIQKTFSLYKMPYISITPTFSICQEHGYIGGEYFECPTCGSETEVWSRVVGYLRPVQNYNQGKKLEYTERKKFVLKDEQVI
jgi:ribonucleoside-triphosphate reductase